MLSEHYSYTTALVLLSQFLLGALPRSLLLGLPVRAMYLALLEWSRAAELSADRAAALVMADPLQPCRVLMELAGGSVPGMNFEAFLKQASEYDERGRPLLAPRPFLVGAEPDPPGGRPARQGAHGVGADRRLRPHPRRRLPAAGRGAAALGRSTRTQWRTTASASRGSWTGRPAGSRSSASASAAGSSAGRTPGRAPRRGRRLSSRPRPGRQARTGPGRPTSFPPHRHVGAFLNRAESHNSAGTKNRSSAGGFGILARQRVRSGWESSTAEGTTAWWFGNRARSA